MFKKQRLNNKGEKEFDDLDKKRSVYEESLDQCIIPEVYIAVKTFKLVIKQTGKMKFLVNATFMRNKMKTDLFAWYTKEKVDLEFENPYRKILFLDIDGVLNVEEEVFDTGKIIEMEKVKLLKSIVDQTGANIILSSSWKIGYKNYVDAGYKHENPDFGLLHDSLASLNLAIDGITPISHVTGVEAKPLEIREWLRKFHSIFSYVILDDSTTCQWGYLQRNVVTTLTYYPDEPITRQYKSGLTEEHVKKAVAVLNDEGAYHIA